MPALIHGGDTYGYKLEYGAEPLDFSANCNPLGVPEGVRDAICASAGNCCAYPDPLCRSLCSAIGDHLGIPSDYILCGNGSADLIFRLAAVCRDKPTLVTAPGFAEYSLAAEAAGAGIRRFMLRAEEGFAVTERILEAVSPDIGLVFLCSPNNPTGLTVPRPLLLRIAERCAGTGSVLLLDECFNGFLDDPGAHTLIPELRRFPNLVILRAFTKLYGMAGVRLGCCLCSDRELIEKMRAAGQPWPVSSLALAAGEAALLETGYVALSRALVRSERAFLKASLSELGLEVLGGEANYIFFRSPDALLASKLRKKGVLLRDCGNYEGLRPGYFRAAVRTRRENEKFIAALKEAANG